MTAAALRDALDGAARELGATSRAGYFSVALSAMKALEKGDAAKAELLLSPLTAELARSFREGLGTAAEVVTDMSRVRLSDKLLLPAASVAVIVEEEVSDLPEAARLVAQGSGSASRAIFVVGDGDNTELRAAMAVPPDIHVAAAPSRDALAAVLAWLDQQLPEVHQKAVDGSLTRISRYAHGIVTDEMKSLELRRQLLTEDINAGRKSGISTGPDINSKIRTVIQKNIQDAERAFKSKYDELSRVKQGEFHVEILNLVAELTLDDMRFFDKASKTETTEAEVQEAFVANFVSKLRQKMTAKLKDDFDFIFESQKMSIDQINGFLSNEAYSPIDPNKLHAPDLQPELAIESHFHIFKRYSGEVTKDGIMQYFIALRDYTGMIMVLVGILAPLTLVATSPDAEPGTLLYFISKTISPLLKMVRSYVTFVTAMLVAAMLIYGFIDLRRRIPQKRIEERERELGKARDQLENEGRRMFNDSARDWLGQIGTYIRDLTASINGEVEQSMRSRSKLLAEASNENRRRLALEQSSVETRLKGVTQLERKFDALVKK